MDARSAVSHGGIDALFDLSPDEPHTFRLESTDGMRYHVFADGRLFMRYNQMLWMAW